MTSVCSSSVPFLDKSVPKVRAMSEENRTNIEENSTNIEENCTNNQENRTNIEENCTNNQENCTNNQQEKMVQTEKTLREKVFEACHNMDLNNKKITRDAVREITGGSDRDLSKYIREYRESKEMVQNKKDSGTENGKLTVQNEENTGTEGGKLTVQNEEDSGTEGGKLTVQNEEDSGTENGKLTVQDESMNGAISSVDENSPEEIENLETDAYYKEPSNDMEAIARRGSEIAAAAMIAEKAVADYMLQNPDELPPDLRERVNQAQAQFDQKIKRRQKQYEPDFFVKGALAAAKRKTSVQTK